MAESHIETEVIGECHVDLGVATEDNQEIVFAPADGCVTDSDGPSDQGDGTSLIWFHCNTGVSGTNEGHLAPILP